VDESQQVAERVRHKAKEFGIQVVDVRIKRADLPNEVEESVFGRMRAERDRVAKQYRSEGEESAAKIRGEGDAASTTIYAQAFGKDPEFYTFQRSLHAYEEIMSAKSTLIVSTGSELFRYLRRSDGGGGKP